VLGGGDRSGESRAEPCHGPRRDHRDRHRRTWPSIRSCAPAQVGRGRAG